jgi:hypothetical protein
LEQLDLTFFPFPALTEGERQQGFRHRWLEKCDHCDLQCERSKQTGLSVCSYGVSFQRLKNGLLIFGIIVASPTQTVATKKLARRREFCVVSRTEYDRVLNSLLSADDRVNRAVQKQKQEIIAKYVADERYKAEYLELMKPVIQRNLAFLHDYSQFVSSVRENINVALYERYPQGDLEAKLAAATEAEAAIYWSSLLMDEKLTTAFLLLHPEKLKAS